LSAKRRRDAARRSDIPKRRTPTFFLVDSFVPPLGKKSRDEVGKMIMTRVHLSPPRTSLGATTKSDGARRAIDSHARVWRPRSIFATHAKSALNYCRSSPSRMQERERERESQEWRRSQGLFPNVYYRYYQFNVSLWFLVN